MRINPARSPVSEIGPVPDGIARPSWSVMLPTYNCSELFEAVLRSVLDQDPGPDRMEIVVVDDCSPRPRHEEIVRRLAPARVEIYRQPSNVGLSGNWNSCIARSRGHWVHILHQDDLVLPGFYDRLARAGEGGEAGAAFCRCRYIDDRGREIALMDLEQPTAGVLTAWLGAISRRQRVQCPSVAVRRAVYEHLGGFRTDLRYALDWEMWVRIAASYPVWYEPETLAHYRIHPENESARLKRGGRYIADIHEAIRVVQGHLPPALRAGAGRQILAEFRDQELTAATQAFLAGELGPGLASLRRAIRCDPSLRFSHSAIAHYKWALKIGIGELCSRFPGWKKPRRSDEPRGTGLAHSPIDRT